jgi:Protein of unknown function (DUF1822)
MSIFDRQTQLLSEIYPEHVWIETTDLPESLGSTALNRYAIEKIRNYLIDLGLVVKSIFPTEESYLPLISQAVDGFCLLIAGVRVAFIPSNSIDLASFEIHQEWIDLSNWAADYYVPFQIDLESHYLHLWGFISHQSIRKKAYLDRILRSYEIDSADAIADLDSLWLSCELVNGGSLASERGEIPSLAPLSATSAAAAIDRLKQHRSIFSPRLLLSFEEWGAILNTPEYLQLYAHPVATITKIANWFRSQVTSIEQVSENIAAQGWLTIEQIYQQPQLFAGYYHTRGQKEQFVDRKSTLNTEQEIERSVKNLYANQNPTYQVDLPTDIDSPLVLLTYLIQHTTDQTLRWQAAEYLWKIEPENNQHWHRRIKDLGLVMQGYKLGLMVAAIPLLDGTFAILNRVYPIGAEACLPASVQLNLLSESGDRLYQVESRSTVNDSYIQLYFTASVGDLFNVCISMNGHSITEAFAI